MNFRLTLTHFGFESGGTCADHRQTMRKNVSSSGKLCSSSNPDLVEQSWLSISMHCIPLHSEWIQWLSQYSQTTSPKWPADVAGFGGTCWQSPWYPLVLWTKHFSKSRLSKAMTGEDVCTLANTAMSANIRSIKERIERIEGTTCNMQKLLGPDGQAGDYRIPDIYIQSAPCEATVDQDQLVDVIADGPPELLFLRSLPSWAGRTSIAKPWAQCLCQVLACRLWCCSLFFMLAACLWHC